MRPANSKHERKHTFVYKCAKCAELIKTGFPYPPTVPGHRQPSNGASCSGLLKLVAEVVNGGVR